jgi:3'(2'), 5'-bisphosphate nucleotidase
LVSSATTLNVAQHLLPVPELNGKCHHAELLIGSRRDASPRYVGTIESSANDHAIAATLASDAGEHLVALRDRLMRDGEWGGWWPEEQGDAEAHNLLMAALASTRPDDGVLSEEGHDDGHRLGHERVWIVDPLDGSSDFGRGSDDWAVHVALTESGKGLAAAVSLPAMGMVFGTAMPPVVPEVDRERPIIVTGRSRVRIDGIRVADALDAELMTCGSAGVKAMLVVTGQVDSYVHAGPLWEWDVCAPAIVAEAAGLRVTDAYGNPLVYNKERAVAPGFIVSRPEIADRVLAALQ